jgi:hypothetical protein
MSDSNQSDGLSIRRRPLSPRQDAVLRALVLWIHRHRSQPSHRELARACGVTSVAKTLLEIAMKGWICGSGRPRAIEIPEDVYDSIVDTGELPGVPSEIEEKKSSVEVVGEKILEALTGESREQE